MSSPNKSDGTTFYQLPAVCVPYEDHFEKSGFVEVAQWHNGEGITVSANDKQPFTLTWAEWDALKKAVKRMNNHDYSDQTRSTSDI